MGKRIFISMIICAAFLMLSTLVLAFDNKTTHRIITEDAIKRSNINTYIKQILGFNAGLDDTVVGMKIRGLIIDGADYEDEPNCRASNHFHNPLLSWGNSFVTDIPDIIATACSEWNPRYSAITWATGYQSRTGPIISRNNQDMGWDDARRDYYNALTWQLPLDRGINFRKTFQAIGKVAHLLQDMAVPAHVRNDFSSHLIRKNAAELDGVYNPIKRVKQPFEYYVENNPTLVTAEVPIFPVLGNLRLTDFWDTDQYNGSNPSASASIGLAELTNANYCSDFTIPNNGVTQEHSFSYPYLSSSNISGPSYQICPQQVIPGVQIAGQQWGSGLVVNYISRKNGAPCPSPTSGDSIDHFAAVSLLNKSGNLNIDSLQYPNAFIWVDDPYVHITYAKDLLPRAVGYSAALLDYFFRGNLEITAPDRCLYGLVDGSVIPQQFAKIKAKVKNVSYIKDQSGAVVGLEEIQGGALQAVAKYKKRTVYQRDLSADPPTASSVESNFSYSVSAPLPLSAADITALNSDIPQEFAFNFESSPIPAGITDLYLQVVFKGTLGNEADNAVAVGFKDLSEPTHINTWNTTDQIYNSLTGQVNPAPDSDKVTLNEKIAFCPAHWPLQDGDEYQVQFMPMGPGEFNRIIFLSDPGIQIFYGVTDVPVNDPNPTIMNSWYLAWTAVYQDGSIGDNTNVYTFREKSFHSGSGYFKYPGDGYSFWFANWPPGVNSDAIPAANLNW